jgi:SNF family Na+-dependent transporter
MESKEAIKEELKVNLEKFKIASTVIILITGGLIGLLFKHADTTAKVILFVVGAIADLIFAIYLWKLDNLIEQLLIRLKEDSNV